jgi:Na+/citrate or Na+/malate symporter
MTRHHGLELPPPSEQEVEFRRQYALRRKRQMALSVPVFFVLIAAVVASILGGQAPGVPGLIVVAALLLFIVGAGVFSLGNWRCPACNRYLGQQVNPRFCSNCGVRLR